MSRIGKKPIAIPAKVKVSVTADKVHVEGPLGKLERGLHSSIAVKVEDGKVVVTRKNEERAAREAHGLVRTLIENMINGVQKPYEKTLDITGVGYRAELEGKVLKLQVGLSHDVRHPIPAAVTCKVDKQVTVMLSSPDKELLGQVAAEIRAYRKAEPYKGKGIKYSDEKIRRKEGKTGAG
ncbi:MAG: 50S ribosomal protein L6 [Myxococcota bacterium]